ncbi:hypothetical protein B0H14DRAFT_2650825 [Mycena olivaceomarginata]|nr:hypothetical protein B0H14DRAFT_2650825 [Mycena olivaceomarginata]
MPSFFQMLTTLREHDEHTARKCSTDHPARDEIEGMGDAGETSTSTSGARTRRRPRRHCHCTNGNFRVNFGWKRMRVAVQPKRRDLRVRGDCRTAFHPLRCGVMRPSTWEARPGKWDARGVLRSRQTVDASREDVLQRGLRMYGIRGKFHPALENSRYYGISMGIVNCDDAVDEREERGEFHAVRYYVSRVVYHREGVVARSVTDRGREWCSGLSELLSSLIASLGGWRFHNQNCGIGLLSNSNSGATFPQINQPLYRMPDCVPLRQIYLPIGLLRARPADLSSGALEYVLQAITASLLHLGSIIKRQVHAFCDGELETMTSFYICSPVTRTFLDTGCRSGVASGLLLPRLDPLSATSLSIGPIDPGCPLAQHGVTTEFNSEISSTCRGNDGSRTTHSTKGALRAMDGLSLTTFLARGKIRVQRLDAQRSRDDRTLAELLTRDTGENESLEEDTTSIRDERTESEKGKKVKGSWPAEWAIVSRKIIGWRETRVIVSSCWKGQQVRGDRHQDSYSEAPTVAGGIGKIATVYREESKAWSSPRAPSRSSTCPDFVVVVEERTECDNGDRRTPPPSFFLHVDDATSDETLNTMERELSTRRSNAKPQTMRWVLARWPLDRLAGWRRATHAQFPARVVYDYDCVSGMLVCWKRAPEECRHAAQPSESRRTRQGGNRELWFSAVDARDAGSTRGWMVFVEARGGANTTVSMRGGLFRAPSGIFHSCGSSATACLEQRGNSKFVSAPLRYTRNPRSPPCPQWPSYVHSYETPAICRVPLREPIKVDQAREKCYPRQSALT